MGGVSIFVFIFVIIFIAIIRIKKQSKESLLLIRISILPPSRVRISERRELCEDRGGEGKK